MPPLPFRPRRTHLEVTQEMESAHSTITCRETTVVRAGKLVVLSHEIGAFLAGPSNILSYSLDGLTAYQYKAQYSQGNDQEDFSNHLIEVS